MIPSQPLRTGQTRESPEEDWLRVVQIPAEQLPVAESVARLAIELCKLKKEAELVDFEARKKNYERERNKTIYLKEKQTQLEEDWKKETQRHLQLLTPVGYIPEAWKLLLEARAQATQPQSFEEFLKANLDDPDAMEKALDKRDRDRLIPFRKLCDPERNRGDSEPIDGIEWRVFAGKKGSAERDFKELFWRYWSHVGKRWQAWEKNPHESFVPIAYPDVPSIRVLYWRPHSDNEIARTAEVARDAAEWRRRGLAVLSEWKQDGIRPSDFRSLAGFRKQEAAAKVGNLKGQPQISKSVTIAKKRARKTVSSLRTRSKTLE